MKKNIIKCAIVAIVIAAIGGLIYAGVTINGQQKDLDKHSHLIQKTKILLDEVAKDYNALKKNKNNRIIYGYNILEKYSLYEKYIVGQENLYNYEDQYYKNYGGNYYGRRKH